MNKNEPTNEKIIPGAGGIDYHKINAAVAFLDLLGFKQYSFSDPDAALHLLFDYMEILTSKFLDNLHSPPSSYIDNELRKIAKYISIEDFNYFLPFSDSIIIASKNPDDFVHQLAAFLYDCFDFKANAYANPIDENEITNVEVTNIDVSNANITKSRTHWYPVLFRVGLSYGECMTFPNSAIIKEEYRIHCNLFGQTYIKAVGLEQSGEKGPRVICDDSFIAQLSSDSKRFIQPIFGTKYHELLWVGVHIYDTESGAQIETTFGQLISIACKFWNMYSKDAKTEPHYRQFLRLIYHSARKVDYLKNNGIFTFSNQLLSQIEQECKSGLVVGFLDDIAK